MAFRYTMFGIIRKKTLQVASFTIAVGIPPLTVLPNEDFTKIQTDWNEVDVTFVHFKMVSA